MSWNDERVERLKTLWNEGKSASQIAKELGGVTRNAVIGKVHRLGLSNRNTTPASTTAKAAAAKPAAPMKKADKSAKPEQADKIKSAKPAPADEAPANEAAEAENVVSLDQTKRKPIFSATTPRPPVQPAVPEISEEAMKKARSVEKKSKRLSLMELTERTCKWPVGDPATENFWFCGMPSEQGKPYCDAHSTLAFQPALSRRDRRK